LIILATGASQFEFLECFIKKTIDWSRVTGFHLDEYIGIPPQHPASFRKYLCDRVFSQVKMKEHYLIQGDRDNPQNEPIASARFSTNIASMSLSSAS